MDTPTIDAAPAAATTTTDTASAPAADSAPKQTATSASALATETKSAADPAPPPKRYKVKIDGEELEVPEDELLRGYQRGAAARKRFEEAQRERAEIEELKKLGDPWKIAQKLLGKGDEDLDQLAEQRLLARLQRESMTPEQRRIAELEAERDRYATEAKNREAAELEAKVAAQTNIHREQLNRALPAAMDAAQLPRTPEAARLVIGHLETMVKMGLELDVQAAAEMAREDLVERNSAIFRGMSPEMLERALGKETIAAILRRSLEAPKPAPTPNPTPEPKPEPKKNWLSSQEWAKEYGLV